MTAICVDPTINDEQRRSALYQGDIMVLSPTRESLALTDFAREMLEEAFAPHDPVMAQYEMPVERFVETFAPVKPQFIHHPRTRALLRDVILAAGCDASETYLDVPRLRGVTSDGYLTSGVGYAHHPHRDTWYSAPMAQLNWWLPIYDFESGSSMAFLPRYWNEGLRNDSDRFSYYDWNANARKDAAKHVHADTRWQPHAAEPIEQELELRVVCPVGGTILFSPAHLHATVPNNTGRTRFSIDFRTVNLSDLVDGRSAPNVDSRPRGTSLRDFRSAADDASIPDSIVADHEGTDVSDGVLVFRPS